MMEPRSNSRFDGREDVVLFEDAGLGLAEIVRTIPKRLLLVLEEAKRDGVAAHVAADRIVERRLMAKRSAAGA